MKKVFLLAGTSFLLANSSMAQNRIVIENRQPVNFSGKTPVAFKRFDLAEAKVNGQQMKPTDKIKTISGKEITVEEYLARVNKIEQEINKRGYSLRKYEIGKTSLKFKPVNISNTEILRRNQLINTGVKAPLGRQQRINMLFPQKKTTATSSATAINKTANTGLITQKKPVSNVNLEIKREEKRIEEEYSIAQLLKPLTDRIQESMGNDGAKFNLANASLKVSSYAVKPLGGNVENGMGTTSSEYKVAVNFNANVSGSFGLPFTITIPMATMNGEFTARANNSQAHERKVVVNLMGRSFFNKTTNISSATFSESDEEELQLSEIMPTRTFSSLNFMDWLPSIGINTTFSLGGSVGCSYDVQMDRNGVSAHIGPTYGTTLRVAASYGMEDVLEGGIEGIITLVKGGLGFGGTAGLAREEGVWRLKNISSVEATLEALKGEINLFVRYPDLSNWSCFAPCTKKETIPIYETPTAFRLNGTLLESDKGFNLDW